VADACPVEVSQTGVVCDEPDRNVFPDAQAYAGPGPHPIVVVGFDDDSSSPRPAVWKPRRSEIQNPAVQATPGFEEDREAVSQYVDK
jgi:hypothetical protein